MLPWFFCARYHREEQQMEVGEAGGAWFCFDFRALYVFLHVFVCYYSLILLQVSLFNGLVKVFA